MVRGTMNRALDEGLVLHLPMSEGIGTKVFDRSQYQNHGVVTGAAWINSRDGFGKALDFNGTTDDIVVADDTSLDVGTHDFSISFWMESTKDAGVAQSIVDKRKKTGIDWVGYVILLDSSERAACSLFYNDGANVFTVIGLASLDDGEWHLITVTIDRDGLMSLYVDKILVDTVDISAQSAVDITTGSDLMIAEKGDPNSGNINFEGAADGLRMYNRVLTPREVRQLSVQRGRI